MGTSTHDTTTGSSGAAHDLTGKLIILLAEMLNRTTDSITKDMRLFDDLSFDSTSVLELLLRLEDEFEVEFDPELLEPDDFATVTSLAAYVEKELAQS